MEKALSNYRASLRREFDDAYSTATDKQKALVDSWLVTIEQAIHDLSCGGHRSYYRQLFETRKDEDYDFLSAFYVQIYFQSEGFKVTLTDGIKLEIKW